MKLAYDVTCFNKEDFESLEGEDIEVLEYHQKAVSVPIPVIVMTGMFLSGFLPSFGKGIGSHLGDKIGKDLGKVYDKIKKSLVKAFQKTPNKKILLVFEDDIEDIYYHVAFELNDIKLLNSFIDDVDSIIKELAENFKEKKDIIRIGVSFINEDLKEVYYIDKNEDVYTSQSASE